MSAVEQLERPNVASRVSVHMDVDLAQGLALSLRSVDAVRPDTVTIRFGSQPVGIIPAVPGAERLTGEHVKASLARELAGSLVLALGRAGAVGVRVAGNRHVATRPIPADVIAF